MGRLIENGEILRILEKIAEALDAELDIRFIPKAG
jgi:hypothetical protein